MKGAHRGWISISFASVAFVVTLAGSCQLLSARKRLRRHHYSPAAPPTPARIPATGFVMPDLPDDWKNYTSYDGRLFSTPLVDYNAFIQDADSKTQVGNQKDQWDLRRLRLMFRGQMKFRHPVDHLISVGVKGQGRVRTGTSKFGFTDVEFSTSVSMLGRLKYGKIKEPVRVRDRGRRGEPPAAEAGAQSIFCESRYRPQIDEFVRY